MNDEQVLDLITNTLASSQERMQVSSYELAFWRWHATRVVEALRGAGVLQREKNVVPAAHVPPKVSYPRIRPGHV